MDLLGEQSTAGLDSGSPTGGHGPRAAQRRGEDLPHPGRASGSIQRYCAMFGPGGFRRRRAGAVIPALLRLPHGGRRRSRVPGRPRGDMVEMVVSEPTTLEADGRRRLTLPTVSASGQFMAAQRGPTRWARVPTTGPTCRRQMVIGRAVAASGRPKPVDRAPWSGERRQAFDMAAVVRGLVEEDRCSRSTRCGRAEIVTGFDGWDGRSPEVIREQPDVQGRGALPSTGGQAALIIRTVDAFGHPAAVHR